MTTSFERLEALNVEIATEAGCLSATNIHEQNAARRRYAAALVARKAEVQSAVTAARADTQRYLYGRVSPHVYIDGIAAALTRATLAHAKGELAL